MDFSQYLIENNDMVICEPCVCVTLFSDADLGMADAPDMLGPYRAFLNLFKDQVRYCILDGNQMHAKAITPALLQNLPDQMQNFKRRKKGGVIAELFNGATRDELRAPSFMFDYSKIGKPHTYVRVCFPLEWFRTHKLAGVQHYLQESLKGFVLQAGYVGYCFVWNREFDRELEPYFLRWLQRHPGIMCPNFAQEGVSIHGLTDLGWITLLGQEFVKTLGGTAALRQSLGHIPNITVDELADGGVSVRIGDAPSLGDTQEGDMMDDYCALGKVLNPLRNPSAIIEEMTVTGMSDLDYPGLCAKWLNRFFPE